MNSERSASAIADEGHVPDVVRACRLEKPAKFRVLFGIHAISVKEGPTGVRRQITYGPRQEAGDIVESTVDLCKRFNRPGSVKYERLRDDGDKQPAGPARDDFDNKSLEELWKFIEEENDGLPEDAKFQLDKKMKKHELIRALRNHVPSAAVQAWEERNRNPAPSEARTLTQVLDPKKGGKKKDPGDDPDA